MEERVIKVMYEDKTFVVKSDTPDFKNIIDFIKTQEILDSSLFNVACDDEKFDAETFKEALVDTINDLLDKLRINKDAFDGSFKKLNIDNNRTV